VSKWEKSRNKFRLWLSRCRSEHEWVVLLPVLSSHQFCSAALKLKVEKHERPFQRSVLSKLFRGKPNIVKMLEICDTIVKSDRFNKAKFKAFLWTFRSAFKIFGVTLRRPRLFSIPKQPLNHTGSVVCPIVFWCWIYRTNLLSFNYEGGWFLLKATTLLNMIGPFSPIFELQQILSMQMFGPVLCFLPSTISPVFLFMCHNRQKLLIPFLCSFLLLLLLFVLTTFFSVETPSITWCSYFQSNVRKELFLIGIQSIMLLLQSSLQVWYLLQHDYSD
jgi:hypothetical protein